MFFLFNVDTLYFYTRFITCFRRQNSNGFKDVDQFNILSIGKGDKPSLVMHNIFENRTQTFIMKKLQCIKT